MATIFSFGERIEDVLLRDAADDAVAQRLEDVAAFHDRRDDVMPSDVPQSSSMTMTSWATSTSRRVR